jgi:uncharacterized protein (TIGR03067 family)
MRRIYCAGLALVIILITSSCNQQRLSEQLTGLEGDWAVVAMRGENESATPTELKGMRWSVKGNEIMGFDPDGSSGKMAFKLDETKNPHWIDISALDGNRKGETDAGIYSVDGQQLHICLAEIGKSRPGEFRAGPDSWIMELERSRR